MTNFLKETREVIKANNKTTDDVIWVGNGEYVISWSDFEKIANVDYDSGYGAQEMPTDILIVGKDWWMEREEYDGAESWSFKTLPKKQEKTKPFKHITIEHCMWMSLADLNDEKKRKEHTKWLHNKQKEEIKEYGKVLTT